MKEKLTQLLGYPVLFVHQTGSQVYATNNADCDYIVVVDNWNKKFEKIIDGKVDYFCYSKEYFEKWATMQLDARMEMYSVMLLYGKTIVGENPILGYDWYSYANASIKSILKHCKNMLNGIIFSKFADGERMCSKLVCYPLLAYFAKVNGGNNLNGEQLRLLQLCHDGKLSVAVAKDLQARLYRMVQQSL